MAKVWRTPLVAIGLKAVPLKVLSLISSSLSLLKISAKLENVI